MFTVNLPSANASAIRADGYSARCHASFFVHKLIASGELNVDPFPFANGSYVFIDYLTGAYTDLERGMEIVFTDASGHYKGRSHIRVGGNIDTTAIPIEEYALAKLNLAAGDLAYIYDEHRLHPKIVYASAHFEPEILTHTDEGSNPPPRILTGGAWAGRADAGQDFASVPFDYTGSRNTDPDSTPTDVSFTTRTQTGVTAASGYTDTDDQIVLEIAASATAYTVTVEGEDDDNGKVTLRRTPVMVHDDDHPPHEVIVTAYDGTQENGFNFTIEVVDGAVDIDTIPEGCLCVLWTDERHNEAWASYRNRAPGREHIIGVGYIRRETLSGDGETGVSTTAFEVESPLSILRQLTSYSKVMEQAASPDSWAEVKTLSIKRAIIQLLQFYTNLLEVFDVSFDAAFLDKAYPALYLQRSNVADQVKELADGVDARMVCDRTGRIDLHTFPPFIPLADRPAIATAWDFDADDVIAWEINSIHYDPVEQMKTSGFTAGLTGNSPVFSLYPGHAPGTGIDAPTRDRLIVDDQDDINARTSYYGTFYDDVYMDSDGLKYRAFELRMTLRGGYNFFDFSKAYTEFTEALQGLTRIEDLTLFLFYLTNISWTAGENGEGETQVTFKVATGSDAPSETYVPPDESLNYPSIDYPSPPWTPLPSATQTGVLGRGTANLVILGSDTNLFYVDLRTGTYSLVTLSGLSGTPVAFILNPFQTDQAGIATTTQARFVSDLWDTPTLSTAHSFAYTSAFRTMQSSRCTPGLFVVNSHDVDGACDIDISLDASTWSLAKADLGTAYPGGGGDTVLPAVFASEHVAGKLYACAYTGGTVATRLYVSTDGAGATWSNLDSNTQSNLSPGLTVPVQATSDNVIYHGGETSGKFHLYKTVNGTRSDVSPVVGGEWFGPRSSSFAVKTCDIDQNTVLLVGESAVTSKFGVFLSRDGAQTWTTLIAPDSGVLWRSCNIAGDDRNTFFLWGANGALAVSYDGGATWLDRSYTGVTSALFLNIIGR